MPEAVRVRDPKTNAEYTTYSPGEGVEVLKDVPALDADGNALPPVYLSTEPKPAGTTSRTAQGRTATPTEES